MAHVVEWSEELALGVPQLDGTHEEFVALLAQAATAADADVLAQWERVVAHTESHFRLEEQWMAETNFSGCDCHGGEHNAILAVMREAARRGAAGQLDLVRQLAGELGVWFAGHAQGMDAALAEHLKTAWPQASLPST